MSGWAPSFARNMPPPTPTPRRPGGPVGVAVPEERPGAGGNTPLSKPDEVVEVHGVTIMGPTNLPGALSADASSLYARNLFNFISLIVDKKSGALNIDWNDEIVKTSAVTKDGAAVSRG